MISPLTSLPIHLNLMDHFDLPTTSRHRVVGAFDAELVSSIDRKVKEHVDNVLYAVEGISARLSQLETRTSRLEGSIDDMKESVEHNQGRSDGKLRELVKILREVILNYYDFVATVTLLLSLATLFILGLIVHSSGGRVLPEMEAVETWVRWRERLTSEGRIMVNCRGSDGGSGMLADDKEGRRQNKVIGAISEAFGGQCSWKRMSMDNRANYMALTGALLDVAS